MAAGASRPAPRRRPSPWQRGTTRAEGARPRGCFRAGPGGDVSRADSTGRQVAAGAARRAATSGEPRDTPSHPRPSGPRPATVSVGEGLGALLPLPLPGSVRAIPPKRPCQCPLPLRTLGAEASGRRDVPLSGPCAAARCGPSPVGERGRRARWERAAARGCARAASPGVRGALGSRWGWTCRSPPGVAAATAR